MVRVGQQKPVMNTKNEPFLMDTMDILQINSEIYMLVCKEMSSKCLENPLYLLTLNPSQKKKDTSTNKSTTVLMVTMLILYLNFRSLYAGLVSNFWEMAKKSSCSCSLWALTVLMTGVNQDEPRTKSSVFLFIYLEMT